MKCEMVTVSDVSVQVDISNLVKSEEIYFNVSNIAKKSGKKAGDFLRLDSTKEYIDQLKIEFLEAGYPASRIEFVRKIRGGKHQGTWLHQELAFEFFGWLSAKFRRQVHKYVQTKLTGERDRKIAREKARCEFRPMTDAIKAAHVDPKPYHFSNEANMLNKALTGLTAKQFCETQGVKSLRDGLETNQIIQLERMQAANTVLIESDLDYQQRKCIMSNYIERQQIVGKTSVISEVTV